MKRTTFFFGISWLLLLTTQSQSFKVTPASVEFQLKPGQSASRQITVENTSDKAISFVIRASDLAFDTNGNYQFKPAGTTERSCAKNLTISPNFISLNPNETATLNVMMNIPEEQLKTTWGLVNIRPEKEFTGQAADKGVVRAGLLITPEIAVKVLQVPPGLATEKMKLNDFKELKELSNDTVRMFAVHVLNEGEVPTKCKVYMIISNLENLQETILEPIEFSVMPETGKQVKIPMQKQLKPGNYSLAAILDYGEEYDLEGMEMDLVINDL
jgi:P pilus assembly chaperone PapD